MFGEAAQDGGLGAQQVAFRGSRDYLAGGKLHRLEGFGGVIAGQGDGLAGGGFATRGEQFFGAQDGTIPWRKLR